MATWKIDMPSIEKLNGDNYATWKKKVELLLKVQGFMKIVSGESRITDSETEEDKTKWEIQDMQAQLLLLGMIDEKQTVFVDSCSTSSEIWGKLRTLYEKYDPSSKIAAQTALFSYIYNGSRSMAEHIAHVENLAKKLKDTGETVSDEVIMARLLYGLPESYGGLLNAWNFCAKEQQTLPKLTQQLIREESRLNSLNSIDAGVMNVQLNRDNKGQADCKSTKTQKNKRNVTCFFCKKKGHYASECRVKKRTQHADEVATKSAMLVDAADQNDQKIECNKVYSVKRDAWLADSGATHHMVNDRSWFTDFSRCDSSMLLADKSTVKVEGRGTVAVEKFLKDKWQRCELLDVLYVPSLSKNLLSVGTTMKRGFTQECDSSEMRFLKDNELFAVGKLTDNNTYRMLFRSVTKPEVSVVESELLRWHERLGHINMQAMKQLSNKKLTDIKCEIPSDAKLFCEACQYGKAHRLPFQKRVKKTDIGPGDMIHTDVNGPMPKPSVNGAKYFVLFKDEYSGFRYVYMIKNKSDVFSKFTEFACLIRNKFGRSIKKVRSDNGLEYINKQFSDYFARHGIERETSAPYTPQQNGRSERDNRTIVEAARSMMCARNVPEALWAEAVQTAVYILNRTPTKQAPDSTPYEMWTGTIPRLNHIRTFGCVAYELVPGQQRNKWDPKARKKMFVGYDNDSPNYKLYDPLTRKFTISRDVTFQEDVSWNYDKPSNLAEIHFHVTNKSEDTLAESSDQPEIDENSAEVERVEQPAVDDVNKIPCKSNERQLRNRDKMRPIERFEANIVEFMEPSSYNEALQSPEAEKWQDAIDEELSALAKNDTWSLVTLPSNRKTISARWTFKIKRDVTGEIARYKARLVAKGFQQRPGIDYNETFSPVVRYESVRVLLALAASRDYEIGQFDIKTAFLNGDLDEEIYMKIPEGVSAAEGLVCKLNKSLYGLKQSPRQWNKKFDEFLRAYDFRQSSADHCIYSGHYGESEILLALYVDDGLVMSNSKTTIDIVLRELRNQFEVTIGDCKLFAGLEIRRDRQSKKIVISQERYISRVLERFNMNETNPCATPVEVGLSLEKGSSQSKETDMQISAPYRQAVGCLMFAAVVSRPDIMFAVSLVSRFVTDPKPIHWTAVKRIFRYLKGTMSEGIVYGGDKEDLIAFSDSDYAGCLDSRKSTSGYLFTLAGSAVTWSSQRQSIVALSTTEAEYVSACEAAKEAIWLRLLLSDVGVTLNGPTQMQLDNQGSIKLIENPAFHKRTKHIDVRYHFIREKYESGEIDIVYVNSKAQLADIFTKGLPRMRFQELRSAMGMDNMNVLQCELKVKG